MIIIFSGHEVFAICSALFLCVFLQYHVMSWTKGYFYNVHANKWLVCTTLLTCLPLKLLEASYCSFSVLLLRQLNHHVYAGLLNPAKKKTKNMLKSYVRYKDPHGLNHRSNTILLFD